MADSQNQIVYVLTNPAMPGLVKIGMTTQMEVEERMKQLYGTGVPVPFECAFACRVKDANVVEKAFHYGVGAARLNPNREFFKIEADRVIAILKLLEVVDVTQQIERTIEADIEQADKQAGAALKVSRRPRMNFEELGIPIGSILVSKDGAHKACVVADKKVEYQGEVCSLTAATRKVLGLPSDYPLQPSPHWTFNGKTLKELYEEVHVNADES